MVFHRPLHPTSVLHQGFQRNLYIDESVSIPAHSVQSLQSSVRLSFQEDNVERH